MSSGHFEYKIEKGSVLSEKSELGHILCLRNYLNSSTVENSFSFLLSKLTKLYLFSGFPKPFWVPFLQ